jgi:hypothetical protein
VFVSGRSLSTLLLALALSAGDPALCAGWIAVPDSPMACCAEGQACPMHAPDAEGSGSTHRNAQRAADNCCVVSGQPDAAPLASATSAFTSYGVVPAAGSHLRLLPPIDVGPARTRAWSPGPSVLRHVLFSVFLV